MTAKKRPSGDGSIRLKPNGITWEARLTYVDPITNQRKRTSFTGRTQKEARAKMTEARKRLEAGAPVQDNAQPVGDWVTTWCDTTLKASPRKPATREQYRNMAKHLQTGDFAAIPLDKLKPIDVTKLLLELCEAGLSDSTIRSVYTVARIALDDAVINGLLATNPVAKVARPGVARREAVHLPAADVSALLTEAKASRYYPALVLIAATGCRRGEALALRWKAVDFHKGTAYIGATVSRVDGRLAFSEPKTQRSRRVVPLAPAVIELLMAHRATQDSEREMAANLWEDNDLVFCTELGRPVEPRNLLRVIEAAAKSAGVEGAGVHVLRHSAATALLESGVHLKAVSDLLGHSSVAITGDVYAHTSGSAAAAAVAGLADALGLEGVG